MSDHFPPADLRFMARALALAERGRRLASPNPMVGCVLVKGGRVVGEGHHAAFGGPHAEAAALQKAGARAKGAAAYVTLEPCAHWGKTAPCADALIRAGIRRVVAAAQDPNPRVAGRGLARLRQAGVRIATGVLAREARHLNRAFFKAQETGLPWVIWKTAQTLDGKIASRTGASRYITNPEARALAHRLRAESDAILVGGNTVRLDNPRLTSHGHGPDPLKLILSGSLRLSPKAKVFQKGETWILTRKRVPPAVEKAWDARGVKILKCFDRFTSNEFHDCFKILAKIGLIQVFMEGGGDTAAALLEAGLVDEVYHVIAPHYLGGRDAKTPLEGRGWARPGQGPALQAAESYPIGDNVVIHGFLRTP